MIPTTRPEQRTLLALAEEQQKLRGRLGRSVRVDVVEVVWERGGKGHKVRHYPGAVTAQARRP